MCCPVVLQDSLLRVDRPVALLSLSQRVGICLGNQDKHQDFDYSASLRLMRVSFEADLPHRPLKTPKRAVSGS